jgi:butyrate kinase
MQLMKLCYSGKYSYEQMQEMLMKSGGMYAYLGTKDVREAEERAAAGDEKAQLVLEAMAYQIAKEIGAMAVVLEGDLDRIIITGGIACSEFITGRVIRMVGFLAPVEVVPGEEELESLALGGLRVLRGEEKPKVYRGTRRLEE